MPYRESQAALAIQGIALEVSHCERLTQQYGTTFYEQVCQDFAALAQQPLVGTKPQPGKVQVLQADGVFVMEKDKPSKGLCEGREVKHVLVYPLEKAQERRSIACSDSTISNLCTWLIASCQGHAARHPDWLSRWVCLD